MKNNKRPELVISFAGLNGQARQIVSEYIQNALFKLGYIWSHGLWDGKPEKTDASMLYICSQSWNPRHITYSDAQVVDTTVPTIVYNAVVDIDAFLTKAKENLVAKTTIGGVIVTITPSEVKLDATELLSSVGQKAQAIQSETFGR